MWKLSVWMRAFDVTMEAHLVPTNNQLMNVYAMYMLALLTKMQLCER